MYNLTNEIRWIWFCNTVSAVMVPAFAPGYHVHGGTWACPRIFSDCCPEFSSLEIINSFYALCLQFSQINASTMASFFWAEVTGLKVS